MNAWNKPKVLAVAFIVMISVASGFAGGWFGARSNQLQTKSDEFSQQVVLNESQLISNIASEVGESVVSINVESEVSNRFFPGETELSAGSGFIISADGYIVTNRHVVGRGATKVTVVLSDGTELSDVKVVGRTSEDDPLDIAFLKVGDHRGKALKPIKRGDSSKVKVGDKVIAIGNALGQFQNTVTAGIISGFGRQIEAGDFFESETLQNLFQTDAAINQGNSGGPLVNINGEVIAINTAVAGGAENIGFAIPINDVSGLISSVLEQGRLVRPLLGVRYIMLTDDIAKEFELSVNQGAFIVPSRSGDSVVPGSPAEAGGLKEQDVITAINGQPVDKNNSLVSVIGRFKPGERVTLTVQRGDEQLKIEATLAESTE